jgi:hypothetical protein
VPEPAPHASVTVEVERSESVASVRPADPE